MLTILFVLLATGASGQTHEQDSTQAQDAWLKLHYLTESADAPEHLKRHGVTLDLEKLRTYVKASERTLEEFALDKAAFVCANREKFEKDPEALAKFFDRQDAEETALIQSIVDGLPAAIGDANAASFQAFVSHEGVSRSGGYDKSGALRAGKVDPGFFTARVCAWKERQS